MRRTKRVKYLLENAEATNIKLSKEEEANIRKAIDSVGGTKGERYPAAMMAKCFGTTSHFQDTYEVYADSARVVKVTVRSSSVHSSSSRRFPHSSKNGNTLMLQDRATHYTSLETAVRCCLTVVVQVLCRAWCFKDRVVLKRQAPINHMSQR